MWNPLLSVVECWGPRGLHFGVRWYAGKTHASKLFPTTQHQIPPGHENVGGLRETYDNSNSPYSPSRDTLTFSRVTT